MEEMNQTCANCDAVFEKDADQVTRFHVTIAETPYHERDVSILEALATVCRLKHSKLVGFNKMIMCTRCATVVGDLYRSFVELMQLSKSTAYVCKVIMQAEMWHRTRQATIGSGVNPSGEGSPQESEYNEEYLSSVLAVELTEGNREGCGDEFTDHDESSTELQEIQDSRQDSTYDSSDDIRKNNPKKRKLSDSFDATGSDLSINPNSRNRRKSAMPIKIFPTEGPTSPGGSEESQVQESNLRRSDRRRISSQSHSPDDKLKPDEEEAFSDVSESGQTQPLPKKRKKKGILRGKKKFKGVKRQKHEDNNGDEANEILGLGGPQSERGRQKRVLIEVPCKTCGEIFNYNWMLDHHIQIVHENRTVESCSTCGFKYFTPEMLENHRCIPEKFQSQEKVSRPFRCKFCGKTLMNRGHFALHCATHDATEEQRYKCPHPDCKLSFKFPKNLAKHEKTHLEEKSWQCSVCGKVFHVKRNLTIHQEIHKLEKKYLCPTCGERFAQRRGLFRHMNTHGSNLKYKCPICGKGFKRKDHVTQHLNSKVHPKIQLDGNQVITIEGVENNGSLALITYEADGTQIEPVEVIIPDAAGSTPPHGNTQQQLHQSHTFISNPNECIRVLSQHPSEFAFSDLLTL